VIVLDTHIWIWWVHGSPQLLSDYRDYVQEHEADGLGISAISCWEVAELVEGGRITLPLPVGEWLAKALAYPGMRLLDLSPQVAVASTQLPGTFGIPPTRSSWRPLVSIIVLWSRWTQRYGRTRTFKWLHKLLSRSVCPNRPNTCYSRRHTALPCVREGLPPGRAVTGAAERCR
jgi:PIN domain nuclease of toxin-antitoxin system